MISYFAANGSQSASPRAVAALHSDVADLDDLAWPVTTADCAVLIVVSIAALIATGALAAWLLVNIISIG